MATQIIDPLGHAVLPQDHVPCADVTNGNPAITGNPDAAQIAQAFGSDQILGPLVTRSPGLRIPGVWHPFECAVRAILGQQISVVGARTLATRLVERMGTRVTSPAPGLTTLFPSPRAILEGDLRGLGLTRGRMAAIQSLAQAVAAGQLGFAATTDEVLAALTQISGVGQWTAQYVALRALGDPDAFPTSDLVLRRMAGGAKGALSEAELESRAEAWRPWRGYAATYLWDAAVRSAITSSEVLLRSASAP